MRSFLRALFRGVPLAALAAGGLLAVLTGGVAWGALGAVVAVAVAAPKHLSRRWRLLERAAGRGGVPEVRRLEDLRTLAASLDAVQGAPGAEHQALQLREQFDDANAKLVGFREVLTAKFDPGELTFRRYLASAEQVYLALLDDTEQAVTILRGLKAVDLDRLRAQVRMLERRAAPGEAEGQEREALEQRLALHERELEEVRARLSSNERSLTALTQAGAALARIETTAGRAALGAEEAMGELEVLAARAERYSLSGRRAREGAESEGRE